MKAEDFGLSQFELDRIIQIEKKFKDMNWFLAKIHFRVTVEEANRIAGCYKAYKEAKFGPPPPPPKKKRKPYYFQRFYKEDRFAPKVYSLDKEGNKSLKLKDLENQ